MVLQSAGEAKGNKDITCKEQLWQNDHSLNWFPPHEQPQYNLKFYKSSHSKNHQRHEKREAIEKYSRQKSAAWEAIA